jgi:hypothetical protein
MSDIGKTLQRMIECPESGAFTYEVMLLIASFNSQACQYRNFAMLQRYADYALGMAETLGF